MKAYKWKVLYNPKTKSKQLTGEEIVDILLANRGITTKEAKEEFLNPKLSDATLQKVEIDIKEVKKTIERIKKAIDGKEKIIIFGDYDVDGICGTAILWETIFSKYENVRPHIPHRVDEGYGLSVKGIDHVLSENPDTKLIITVDNGIVAYDATSYAKEKGIDVIITDHHVRGDKTPDAFSIVHTTKLCGTGVAYLLSKEIRSEIFKEKK